MRILKRLLVVVGVALMLLAVTQGTAHAQVDAADEVGFTASAWTLVVAAGAWQLVNLLGIPVLHGLLVKAQASARLKVAATFALTALSTLVSYVVVRPDGTAVLSSSSLTMWAVSLAVTITGHYGIYKPLGVTGSTPTTTALQPTRGIG